MMPISSAIAKASCWSWVTRIAVVPLALEDVAHFEREPLAQVDVEVGERLVEQQQFGARRQRAGQRDALLLAAGEFVRILVALAGRPTVASNSADAQCGLGFGWPRSPKATFSSTVRCGNSA